MFRLNQDGSGFKTLRYFVYAGVDLNLPATGLIQVSDGTLFGTALSGWPGIGGVFKLSSDGSNYQILHNFCACQDDGQSPYAPLFQGSNGVLYGTTYGGGTSNLGTLFRINPNGTGYTNLFSFGNNVTDGANPRGAFAQGPNGAFFGSTYNGGASNLGTVFTINPDGTGYSILYSFGNIGGDGANPPGGLILGTNGGLYGTTYNGGASNVGTVFKINTDGTGYTNLYNFSTNGIDGANPQAGLMQGKDGVLYGTTYNGGTSNLGTVYRLNTDGSGYETLYSFTGSRDDGANPQAELIQGSDGSLYGTTLYGGKGGGTVYRVTGLPVIRTQPKNRTVLAGTNISFSVTVSSTTTPGFQWFFNSDSLLDATNATLNLTNVQPGDSGSYRVVVTNSYGATTSAVAVLLVVPAPPVPVTDCTEEALRYSMAFGGNVAITCDGTINLQDTITNTVDTVLDATGHQITISGGNTVRLFYGSTNVHFKLVNLTLANGLARNGAGVLNDGGSLSLQDVRFEANTASYTAEPSSTNQAGGGAIFNRTGTVNATNCTFSANLSIHSELELFGGGAIANEGGRLNLHNCVLTGNSAQGTLPSLPYVPARPYAGAASGGAIYSSGIMSATLCTFLGNSATGGGGGDNFVVNSSGVDGGIANGGAICNLGTLAIESSTFINNAAVGGYGGIGPNDPNPAGQGRSGGVAIGGAIFDAGVSTILSSTFSANYTAGGAGGPGASGFVGPGGDGGTGGDALGGALYGTNTSAALTNCTFANNSVTAGNAGPPGIGGIGVGGVGGRSYGGGLFNTNGQIYLDSCTIALNSAHSGGGGISSDGATLVSTLLATNSPDNGSGPITDAGYNLSSDTSCAFTSPSSKNSIDPLLGPLTDNGGPTLTMALLPGSPAIDAGDPSSMPATDQRGFPRVCGASSDIGACEFCYWSTMQPTSSPATELTIRFLGSANQTCRLLASATFTNWIPVATNQIGTDGTITFQIDAAADKQRFFRVAVP